MKKAVAIILAAGLLLGAASAETLNASGTVTAGKTVNVYAPIGGTMETVYAEKGMKVSAGETLAELKTVKIYAPQDGKVTGVFVQPGDSAAEAVSSFGAVMYLEGSTLYSVSASTNKAYSDVETTFVHVGEKVYVECRSNKERAGIGVITAVDGSNYTVQLTEGSFIVGDSVYIYRDEECTAANRIGGGNISRVSPAAISAEGAVVSVAVKDGDTVKKGDVLLETLDGTWDGYVMTGTQMKAAEDSVVAEVSAEAGSSVSKGSTVMKLYPISGMRVESVIAADDLKNLKAGDQVTLELATDENKTYTGTVNRISALAETDTEEVSYRVYIDFTPDEHVSFGMSVEISAGDDRIPAAEEPAEEPAPEEAAEENATEEKDAQE